MNHVNESASVLNLRRTGKPSPVVNRNCHLRQCNRHPADFEQGTYEFGPPVDRWGREVVAEQKSFKSF